MKIQENVNLAQYSTMQVGGYAKYFAIIKTKKELKDAHLFAIKNHLPIKTIGSGSNLVFTDKGFNGLVIKNDISGINLEGNILKANSGAIWDECVQRSVESGLSGIEALSKIPGTAGAAPVQNIGAYGQELSDTLIAVDVYDAKNQKFTTLQRDECDFSYRDSVFKNEGKDRYIITSITLKLRDEYPKAPYYKGIEDKLNELGIEKPSVTDIRRVVSELRAYKLPDPSVIPNNGSFFKNPIISREEFSKLHESYPDIPSFDVKDSSKVKISAGWLIEKAGLKDKELCGLRTYKNHALVLTNPEKKSWDNLKCAISRIKTEIQDKFGIKIEEEPEIVNP